MSGAAMGEAEHFQIKIDCDLSPDGNIEMHLEGSQNPILILKVLGKIAWAILDKVTWTPPLVTGDKRWPSSVFHVVTPSERLKN